MDQQLFDALKGVPTSHDAQLEIARRAELRRMEAFQREQASKPQPPVIRPAPRACDTETARINAVQAEQQRQAFGQFGVAQPLDFGLPRQVPVGPFVPERALPPRIVQSEEQRIAFRMGLDLQRAKDEQTPAESMVVQVPIPVGREACHFNQSVHYQATKQILQDEERFERGEVVHAPNT
jgi:hypothetical protein